MNKRNTSVLQLGPKDLGELLYFLNNHLESKRDLVLGPQETVKIFPLGTTAYQVEKLKHKPDQVDINSHAYTPFGMVDELCDYLNSTKTCIFVGLGSTSKYKMYFKISQINHVSAHSDAVSGKVGGSL